MSGRVAPSGAPRIRWANVGGSGRRGGPSSALVPLLALLAACGSDRTTRVPEGYEIVGGEPSVDPSKPTVDTSAGNAKATDFGSNSPSWIDTFVQQQVPAVDILWVIDNSGSMQPKQEKVKANFVGFMQKLTSSQTLLDYQIGVVTSDTFNPQEAGRLQNKAGLQKPWISRATCSGACDPVEAFKKNANVGTIGSGNEKPLLAAEMALTPPLATTGANAGFLRANASLFVIVLTDEEDGSCAPALADGGGCVSPLTYGDVDYFVRFFEGLKGYGREDSVTVGSIVSLAPSLDLPLGTGRKGCLMSGLQASNRFAYADYAPRLVDVANRTGGLAADICSGDYAGPLASLGFLATGAKTTFFLTRAPFPQDLRVYVTKAGGARTLQVAGADYDYVPCVGSTSAVKNAVEFKPSSLPPAGATVEVEYSVNVRGVHCPP